MCRDCGCETANKKNRSQWKQDGSEKLQFKATGTRTLTLEQKILEKNDRLALANRQWLESRRIPAINLISSPGAGKTLLLEKTVNRLRGLLAISIITGDQERDFDAQRLLAQGAHVKQLNTLSSCHLDASMIHAELGSFVTPESTELLVIENVGNLVCPAAFDLGENLRVALLSTPEGEDKPAKYPLLFHTADLILLTKADLIPHLDWDESLCLSYIRKINPRAPILKLSAKTGEGMDEWLGILKNLKPDLK